MAVSAGAGTLDENIHLFKSVFHAFLGTGIGGHLGGKGVDLREPLNPDEPALSQAITFPSLSVRVTMVLLNEVLMGLAHGNILFTSRRVRAFDFGAAISALAYFLRLTPTVRRGPLRPRALVLVRCPRTGRPRRCLSPR